MYRTYMWREHRIFLRDHYPEKQDGNKINFDKLLWNNENTFDLPVLSAILAKRL